MRLSEGDFAAIAPYRCEVCGPVWLDPTWGEWRSFCPHCGRPDVIDINYETSLPFKAIRRYVRHDMRSAA